ncbi:MAG: NHL repeat-containing protein [Lachnospiraceae bacterium]|nr:NHL repeat-containing protein [Lachnospiraceae bacterium]
MRKGFTKICALAISAGMLFASSISGYATTIDRSYTYNYDYWGDVQDSPDMYSVCKVFTSAELGLEKTLSSPQGLYVKDNFIYVIDTGNNRILVFERTARESIEFVKEIDSFAGGDGPQTFSAPTDLAISDAGNYFIADKGNARILKLDPELNYIMEFTRPVDNSIDKDIVYQPSKIAVDSAERVYCVAAGINKGLIKYESDGSFTGFVGATPVVFDFKMYLMKKIATQEQLNKMESFVPTEYDNLYMDKEGFIYACTGNVEGDDLRSGDADAIRRINPLGDDILIRNGVYYDGKFPIYGDLYMGNGGGYSGPSKFADVTVFDNDSYVCLDRNRGRLFGYDDQGRMIFVFGGAGNMDGYFREPLGLEHMDYDLIVVDRLDCTITLFTLTDYGKLVFDAMDQFDNGEYGKSGRTWREVMKYNGNYDLAYIGLGRAYLRQKEYGEAMDYFKLKYDDENYSKAYKKYRKEYVEDHIFVIVVVLLVLFLVPLGIGKVKSIKREFLISDAFKYNN